MPSLSHRASILQESAIRKLDMTVNAQTGVRFHKLNIGQPDVPTPRALLDVIHAWNPAVIAYGPASGLPQCRDAAAAYHARWSPGLDRKHVAVTSGGSEALLLSFIALCDPGDGILVPEPYYTNYNGFATVAGASVRPVRTWLKDGFALPSDEVLDAAVTPKTRAIVYANPNNPTGAVYPKSDIERLLAFAKRHDLFVVADEVYRRIWFDVPPPSALEFPEYRENVVVIDSTSKTYSACGLRIGFLISRNETVMEKVERLGQARLGPQPLGQMVAITAFGLPESYYEEVRHIYKRRVDAMLDAMSDLKGVVAPRPRGAFYSMAQLPVDDSDKFARWLVTDFRHEGESLVVAPGGGFYAKPESGRTEARFAAVVNEDEIRRAIQLLGLALRAYPGNTY